MDGFRILMEAAKKRKKSIDTTKATHPKVGFAGYAFGSNPGDRPNETSAFAPTLGKGPDMPAPSQIHQHDGNDDHSGVIVMGNGNGGSGAGFSAPVAALMGGGGDGGAAAAGESVEASQLNSIIESYKKDNPSSEVMREIQKIFEGISSGTLYHSCDGVMALDSSPTSDEQISALAASCEASLNAFKNYTGFDYFSWRH